MSKQMHDCGKASDWEHIKAAVLKSEPPFGNDIDFLSEFVIGKAGRSNDVTHIHQFVAAHRLYVPPHKRIFGEGCPSSTLTSVVGGQVSPKRVLLAVATPAQKCSLRNCASA